MESKGLYGKYTIQKTDGTPIDPDADYFILRLDTDKAARLAARRYADVISNINPVLAKELRERCNKYSARDLREFLGFKEE
jgi:hypothetical protein